MHHINPVCTKTCVHHICSIHPNTHTMHHTHSMHHMQNVCASHTRLTLSHSGLRPSCDNVISCDKSPCLTTNPATIDNCMHTVCIHTIYTLYTSHTPCVHHMHTVFNTYTLYTCTSHTVYMLYMTCNVTYPVYITYTLNAPHTHTPCIHQIHTI